MLLCAHHTPNSRTLSHPSSTPQGITAGNAAVGAGTSDHTLTGVNSGSAKIMERSATTRQGITFGNTHSGAGTADLTAQTAGSAGVMQRSEVRRRKEKLNPNLNPQ